LQIFQGGKVLRLQNSTVIRWKTFAVGPSFPFFFYNLLSEGNYFTGKVSRLPTNLRKPRNFSTSNNLQYKVLWNFKIETFAAFADFCKPAKIFWWNQKAFLFCMNIVSKLWKSKIYKKKLWTFWEYHQPWKFSASKSHGIQYKNRYYKATFYQFLQILRLFSTCTYVPQNLVPQIIRAT